jgi:hypothetical protein
MQKYKYIKNSPFSSRYCKMAYRTVQAWTSDLSGHSDIVCQLYYYRHKDAILLLGSIRKSYDSQACPHSDYSICRSVSSTAGSHSGRGGESWTGVHVHGSGFTDTSISMTIYACVKFRLYAFIKKLGIMLR